MGHEFSLSVKVSYGEPAGALTFQWEFLNGGTFSPTSDITGETVSFSFPSPGDYFIQVTATDQAGNVRKSGVIYQIYSAATPLRIGDVNADGVVDNTDVTLVETFINTQSGLDFEAFDRADIDLDGYVNELDLELLKNARDNGGLAPTYFSGDSGSAGMPLYLINPNLLKLNTTASLRFEVNSPGEYDETCIAEMTGKSNWDQITAMRGRPGYMTLMIPLKYSCLTTNETVNVILTVTDNGQETEHTVKQGFVIEVLPEASEMPGVMVLETMARLRLVLEKAHLSVGDYLGYFEATEDEKAALMGMMLGAYNLFAEQYGQFYVAFQQLDEESKAVYERLIRSYGLDEQLELLKELTDQSGESLTLLQKGCLAWGGASKGDELVTFICKFEKLVKIAEIVSKITGWTSFACNIYMGWFAFLLPEVFGIVEAISIISKEISKVFKVIKLVSKFFPKLGKYEITAAHSYLLVGVSTTVKTQVEVKILSGLCNGVLGDLAKDFIKDGIVKCIIRDSVMDDPFLSWAFEKANYDPEEMDPITAAIYKAISFLAEKVIDAGPVQELLKSGSNKICEKMIGEEPMVELSNAPIQSWCGTFTDPTWTCSQDCAGERDNVVLSEEKNLCDPKIASVWLTCRSVWTDTASGLMWQAGKLSTVNGW